MGRLKSILLKSQEQASRPYNCFAHTENKFFKMFWFREPDGFIEELIIWKVKPVEGLVVK